MYTLILVGLVLRGFRILRRTGTVFQRVPPKKGGIFIFAPFTHEVDAISAKELCSFSIVTIVNKVDDKTVRVVPKEQS